MSNIDIDPADCGHPGQDWPYCEACGDERWVCYTCGKSECSHDRKEDVSPMNPHFMKQFR